MSPHTKKETNGFLVSGPSKAHAQSPIWATDMRFCLNLPKGPFYMSAYSKGCCAGLPERLLVAYMRSTLFSCAGSYKVLKGKEITENHDAET